MSTREQGNPGAEITRAVPVEIVVMAATAVTKFLETAPNPAVPISAPDLVPFAFSTHPSEYDYWAFVDALALDPRLKQYGSNLIINPELVTQVINPELVTQDGPTVLSPDEVVAAISVITESDEFKAVRIEAKRQAGPDRHRRKKPGLRGKRRKAPPVDVLLAEFRAQTPQP